MRNLVAPLIVLFTLWVVLPAAASPIQCVPMPLPDGALLPGFCFGGSQEPPPPLEPPPDSWTAPDPMLPPLDLIPPLPDAEGDQWPGFLPPLPNPPGGELLPPMQWPQDLDGGAHSPEPAGFALMSLGLAMIGAALLRRRRGGQRTE